MTSAYESDHSTILKSLSVTGTGTRLQLLCSRTKRKGLVLFETNVRIQRNPVLQGISSNSFVETNQFFSSNSNVILTRQTCGHQKPSLEKSCGNKRRALAFYFSVRIWYRHVRQSRIQVHDFGTCKENEAAQCRLPTISATKHVFKSVFGTLRPHSLCKH